MYVIFKSLLASSVFMMAVPMPAHALQDAPDYRAAVVAEGRSEADVALDESRKPAELLQFMGLEQGDDAIDIFAGGGYYSELMGRVVGDEGSVLAINPPQFVSSDAAKANWAALSQREPNVTMEGVQLSDFNADPESYDFAMLHLIYHDMYWESEQYKFERMDPAAFLKELYDAMKPGGIVAVVDHSGPSGDTREVVEKFHRINEAIVRRDFEATGFELVDSSDMLRMEGDDLTLNVFDPAIRGKTDRFVLKFRKKP